MLTLKKTVLSISLSDCEHLFWINWLFYLSKSSPTNLTNHHTQDAVSHTYRSLVSNLNLCLLKIELNQNKIFCEGIMCARIEP